jgi:hypothetical protein
MRGERIRIVSALRDRSRSTPGHPLARRLCALAEMIDTLSDRKAQRDAVAAFERRLNNRAATTTDAEFRLTASKFIGGGT